MGARAGRGALGEDSRSWEDVPVVPLKQLPLQADPRSDSDPSGEGEMDGGWKWQHRTRLHGKTWKEQGAGRHQGLLWHLHGNVRNMRLGSDVSDGAWNYQPNTERSKNIRGVEDTETMGGRQRDGYW